jgi:hypothetical protein
LFLQGRKVRADGDVKLRQASPNCKVARFAQ